ncbi:MAG: coproporphyrinogen-III oxidase family protein [Sarcina sp.]
MISSLVRIFETRSFKPLKFTRENLDYIDSDLEKLGLYVHIPFCKILCPFCPYYKIPYDKNRVIKYKKALIKEIEAMGKVYGGKEITSIYFGGGTPALMIDQLPEILDVIKKSFKINCSIGIELHPRDINQQLVEKVKKIGFNMVSIGIQSFDKDSLNTLGREYIEGEKALKLIKKQGFDTIDVDLIFGIKGQTVKSLENDFKIAFANGATQVSTYPFIDFSYADNKSKPLRSRDKKELLEVLDKLSIEMNLERTSVWTFSIKGREKYSSVTRDFYVGFGPSAASLTKSYFKINTFSVEEYIKAIEGEKNPKALTLNFSKRVRALYWGFWNAYSLKLNRKIFKEIFHKEIEEVFSIEIKIAKLLGLVSLKNNDYILTQKGSYIYHLLEQHYTHQYIDKTWNNCSKNPWPEEIKLY